jgi:hypothetical protein
VIGCGGQQGCDASRLPYFLDDRHTDDCEVVSITGDFALYPMKIPGTKTYRLSRPKGHTTAGSIR